MLLLLFFNATATTDIYTLSYTTLFRSLGRNQWLQARDGLLQHGVPADNVQKLFWGARPAAWPEARPPPSGKNHCVHHRSEEHTSELQSHSDLVCRLLLEKKKKKHTNHI